MGNNISSVKSPTKYNSQDASINKISLHQIRHDNWYRNPKNEKSKLGYRFKSKRMVLFGSNFVRKTMV